MERRAERRTSLISKRLGEGTTRITINVPDAVATRLHTYLESYTSPRHHGPGQELGQEVGREVGQGEGDRIPVDRKRGQAFPHGVSPAISGQDRVVRCVRTADQAWIGGRNGLSCGAGRHVASCRAWRTPAGAVISSQPA